MQKELSNGTNGMFNSNACDASMEPYASTFGTQEDQQIIEDENQVPFPEFNLSNRRFDYYHLYFSSRL